MYRLIVELLQPFPVLCLLMAVALANLWRKRAETRGRLLLLTIPLVGLVMTCMPAVAHLALGSLEWGYPPRADRPPDVGAIVVLSSSVLLPDAIRREPELEEGTLYRCLHAARLYHRGEPCLVVVSGGPADTDTSDLTLAGVMHDFLREQGVAEEDLLMENQSTNTYENATQTCALLRRRGIRKILLVSTATHLPRAERCFRTQGLEVVASGCQYRATCLHWSLSDFLPSPQAAADVHRAFHEWVGMAWYWLRGRM
ncbi:MAG: hypothetical protein A2V70_10055 [Planctomycetes bacterium RBG_13_63_9]|nr:MAG: hypothetical protein A2V70_10055 [Planctomycetes bacterium RBG_13_63_9]